MLRDEHHYRPRGRNTPPPIGQGVGTGKVAPRWGSSTSRSASSWGSSPACVGKRLFNFAWTKIDDEDPPKGTTEYAPWVKIIGAAALQGVIFKVTRVVVDRYGAIGWTYLTGSWPGEKRPDPDDD